MKLLYFYTRGWGDALLNLATFTRMSIQNNCTLLIYPFYLQTLIKEFPKVRGNTFFGKQSNYLFQYFKPKCKYKFIPKPIKELTLKKLKSKYINNIVHSNFDIEIKDILNFIQIDEVAFSKFDIEYNELDKKYNISDRVAVHLRLDNHINYGLIHKLKKYKKLFISHDNVYIYNLKILPILKNNDIFINTNIYRGDDTIDIELISNIKNIDEKTLYQSKIDALKEAYFLSKSKKFIGDKTSSYSFALIETLRNYYGKFKGIY